jgi:hypothetical protein
MAVDAMRTLSIDAIAGEIVSALMIRKTFQSERTQ